MLGISREILREILRENTEEARRRNFQRENEDRSEDVLEYAIVILSKRLLTLREVIHKMSERIRNLG